MCIVCGEIGRLALNVRSLDWGISFGEILCLCAFIFNRETLVCVSHMFNHAVYGIKKRCPIESCKS